MYKKSPGDKMVFKAFVDYVSFYRLHSVYKNKNIKHFCFFVKIMFSDHVKARVVIIIIFQRLQNVSQTGCPGENAPIS